MVSKRKDVIMGKVEKVEDMAKVLKVELVMKNGKKRDLVITFIHPRRMPREEKCMETC